VTVIRRNSVIAPIPKMRIRVERKSQGWRGAAVRFQTKAEIALARAAVKAMPVEIEAQPVAEPEHEKFGLDELDRARAEIDDAKSQPAHLTLPDTSRPLTGAPGRAHAQCQNFGVTVLTLFLGVKNISFRAL
jgi:hypothetical protein